MVRAAIIDDYQGVAEGLADWGSLSGRVQPDFFREHLEGEEAVVAALARYEIIVAMRERTPFPRTTLERLPNLRLLVTTGPVNASIDGAACRELGIVLTGTRGGGSNTAELTWGLIIMAARHLVTEIANVRSGGWMSTVGVGLRGLTLGVLGMGRLGGEVARVGRAFGMHVIAWSEHLTAQRCEEVGAELVERQAIFRRADFLTIHLQLSPRTRGLVGGKELSSMKPTAWLVNTSRGPICDEGALVGACRDGLIAGAALDVYDLEPLPVDHPFRSLPNVLTTPHIGYVTRDSYDVYFRDALEDIAAFLEGSPIRLVETD